MRTPRGYTLLELMTTMAIAGVLASTAIPSYRNQVCRSRQMEAVTSLQALVKLELGTNLMGAQFLALDANAQGIAPPTNELGFDLASVRSRYAFWVTPSSDGKHFTAYARAFDTDPLVGRDVWQASDLVAPINVLNACTGAVNDFPSTPMEPPESPSKGGTGGNTGGTSGNTGGAGGSTGNNGNNGNDGNNGNNGNNGDNGNHYGQQK